MKMGEKGKPTAIYLPSSLNQMIENTCDKLGMSRSRFIAYCIMRTLHELNVIKTTIHSEEAPQK